MTIKHFIPIIFKYTIYSKSQTEFNLVFIYYYHEQDLKKKELTNN